MVWTSIILGFGFYQNHRIWVVSYYQNSSQTGSWFVFGKFPETRIKFGLGFRTVHSKFEMGLPLLEADSLEFCTPSVSIPPLA